MISSFLIYSIGSLSAIYFAQKYIQHINNIAKENNAQNEIKNNNAALKGIKKLKEFINDFKKQNDRLEREIKLKDKQLIVLKRELGIKKPNQSVIQYNYCNLVVDKKKPQKEFFRLKDTYTKLQKNNSKYVVFNKLKGRQIKELSFKLKNKP